MQKDTPKKALSGAAMAALAFVIPVWIQPDLLGFAHPWLLLLFGAVAHVYQPAYSPTEAARTPEDRWTAAQIIWSIYLCNIAALLEAVLLRWPGSMAYDGWALLGAGLLVGGLALRSWAVLALGRWFSWNVRVQEGQKLVRSGPYRLVRHPSYTGAMLSYFGLPMLFHSWWTLLFAAVALPLAFKRRIHHEERLLRRELDDYDEYAASVPALIPGLF